MLLKGAVNASIRRSHSETFRPVTSKNKQLETFSAEIETERRTLSLKKRDCDICEIDGNLCETYGF